MQSKHLVQVAVLSGLVTAAFASPAYADPAQCQTAQFTDAVTARFPRIREVCQDVINKDGQDYAVVKGYLVRVGNQSKVARIRPILPDGTRGDAMDIEIHPDRKGRARVRAGLRLTSRAVTRWTSNSIRHARGSSMAWRSCRVMPRSARSSRST